MPVKTPLKTVKFAGLCVLAAMVLSVCVQPVDVGGFMKDDNVREQIDKGKEPPPPPPPQGPPSIKVTVNNTNPAEVTWSFSSTSVTLKKDESTTVNLTSTGTTLTEIDWYLEGYTGKLNTTSANSITLSWNDLVATKSLTLGAYKLYVTAKSGSTTYSSEKTSVTVTLSY